MKPKKINTISEFHQIRGLPGPAHPLISLIDYSKTTIRPEHIGQRWLLNFYSIGLKRNVGTLRYGQQDYDFDEGLMSFISPGQILSIVPNNKPDVKPSGWILLIHPDFLWNSTLAGKIREYDFFGYVINEALFLSEKEESTIRGIFQQIRMEYQGNTDQFSQDIILSQIEVLLNYCERFYQRQFTTRKKSSHQVLVRLENILEEYFSSENLSESGLPSVLDLSQQLNLSPNYLSSLLKSLTGLNTQQHIHEKLITKAKEKLSTSDLTVSEIAFQLGFEYSQSFSKLFKAKTNQSPLEFRQSFN